MKTEQQPADTRQGIRVVAGVISVLILTTGLPVAVVVAVRSDPSMWLVAFPSLLVGLSFGSVALTGRWLCFKRTQHDDHR